VIKSIVAIGKPERQVRKASHCGSKQQQRSHAMITLLLLVCTTYVWVLFFAHIPFVVNRTFNATPIERLQHYQMLQIHLTKVKTLGRLFLHNKTQSVKVKNTHASAMFWLEAKLVVCCGQKW